MQEHIQTTKIHTKYNRTVICGVREGVEIGQWNKKRINELIK